MSYILTSNGYYISTAPTFGYMIDNVLQIAGTLNAVNTMVAQTDREEDIRLEPIRVMQRTKLSKKGKSPYGPQR